MKRYLLYFLVCILLLPAFSGCYSYKDMNRMLFFTMGVGDTEDDQFLFYGEAFKAHRSEGEKTGKEKRVVVFGKGESLIEAVEQMRDRVGYPIEYAGNKSFVLSKDLAEKGIDNILDIFGRDQKPSLRIYLLVFNGEASDLLDITMEDEQFMGLYLYEFMNSQKSALSVITNQYYQFIDNLHTGSRINVIPILTARTVKEEAQGKEQSEQPRKNDGQNGEKTSASGENRSDKSSSQNSSTLTQPYVAVDGAAVFVKSKMMTALSRRELEIYNLMTSPVKSGLIDIENPDFKGKHAGFSVLNNKYKSKVSIADGRVKLNYSVNIRVVLLEAQVGISSDQETIHRLKTNLKETLEKRAIDLFEKMRKQKIDLFNIKRKLELARLDPGSDDFLENTDFNIDVHVIIDGLGALKEAYY